MTNQHKIIITRNLKKNSDIKNGLMNILSLKANEGALFNMKTKNNHKFWMKNTFVPLDMIFMTKTNRVVGIVENAKPHDESIYHANVASDKIIEIKAGYVRKHDIRIGDQIDLIYKLRPKSHIRTRKRNKNKTKGRYTRKNKH